MTKQELPTDFDDAPELPTKDAAPELPAKDENGIPYCPKHHVRMKQTSGGKKGSQVAFCKCPVDGCEESGKRIKTKRESSIPSDPQACPRCKTPKGDDVVMERAKKHSTGYYTVLQCQSCGHKSAPLPRPEFVAAQRRAARPHVAELGER